MFEPRHSQPAGKADSDSDLVAMNSVDVVDLVGDPVDVDLDVDLVDVDLDVDLVDVDLVDVDLVDVDLADIGLVDVDTLTLTESRVKRVLDFLVCTTN